MVRKELPSSIYRCKGVSFCAERAGKRIALQIVGRRTEISELDEWGARPPRTQIVAIGKAINAGLRSHVRRVPSSMMTCGGVVRPVTQRLEPGAKMIGVTHRRHDASDARQKRCVISATSSSLA